MVLVVILWLSESCLAHVQPLQKIVKVDSYVQPEQSPAPPLQPAQPRVGAGFAASHAAALARPGRADRARAAAGLRPDMLPVPRQPARRRRAQPGLRWHVCVHQRLCIAAARHAGRHIRARQGADTRRERARHRPGGLLLAAPRPDAGRDGRRPSSRRWWMCGSSSTRSWARCRRSAMWRSSRTAAR